MEQVQDSKSNQVLESLSRLLPRFSDFNFGIILLSTYIFLDFAAFQGLFNIVWQLRIPSITAFASIGYAIYLIVSGKADMRTFTSRIFFILCLFIVGYSQLVTKDREFARADLLLFLQYFSNYVIMIGCIKRPAQLILIVDIWMVAIMYGSMNGIAQGGKIYTSRWLRDENHISLIAAYAIPSAFFLFMRYRSIPKKVGYGIALAYYVGCVVIAASRGGFLAMVAMGLLCWLFIKRKILTLIILGIGVGLVFKLAPPKFFSEMDTLKQGSKEATAAGRIYAWGLAIDMFRDHLLLGVGPENYQEYYPQYKAKSPPPYRSYEGAYEKRVAHSTPCQWLAELGLVGAILLLILQGALFKNWRDVQKFKLQFARSKDEKEEIMLFQYMAHGIAFAHIGFWIASTFLSLMPYPFYWILIPLSETCCKIAKEHFNSIESSEASDTAEGSDG